MMDKHQYSETVFCQNLDSPIGRLLIMANNEGLTEIRFANNKYADQTNKNHPNHLVEKARVQLQDYFDGKLTVFDLPLCPGGTTFQKTVWRQLQKIEYGATASYGEIAAAIAKPKASRAVGMANSKNPLPIVVPCHRIIGKDGSLTGFAGGLETKRWLLDHEQG